MSTDHQLVKHPALGLLVGAVTLTAVVGTGLLLREHGPGNMGNGLLQGGAVGLVLAGVMIWRVSRGRASTFERAWTLTGDEREDAVLTRALAVVGLLAFPLTAVATIAIALGALTEMVLFLLLVTEVAVGAVAFLVISRRS
ncbi:hypothetical protein [Modestobacter roseus]|uniref:hypothetical protein n=1 Tax=Modestobacter roseus TaxID=1181884 RepID=UPI0034DFEC9E